MRTRRLIALAVLLALSTTAGLLLSRRPPELHGTLLDPPLDMAPFSLTSADGVRTGPHDFRGQLVVLFFGFTHCPDVCPFTMHRLGTAMTELGDLADRVQVILVSVDPERDTPEGVDGYARRFDPSFLGVTGSDDELQGVTSAYGIFYARTEVEGGLGYTIDHSASTLVLDQEGRLRLVWPFETPAAGMASDLRYLLRRRAPGGGSIQGARPRAATEVDDAWARPAVAADPARVGESHGHRGSGTSAVYLGLRNPGSAPDRLVGATTDVAAAVELHETRVEDGVMRMRPLDDGLVVAPGGTVELRPGGPHVMLMGLHRDLHPGDRFSLVLRFERAGPVEVEVEVRER